MMAAALKPQQRKLLDFIVAFKTAHDGCAPNTKQMMAAPGLYSTSAVPYHLKILERKGFVRLDAHGHARMIAVVGGRWTPPPAGTLPQPPAAGEAESESDSESEDDDDDETELPPTEVADVHGGNSQSAGQQPTLTFARANDKDDIRPATYKVVTPAAPTRYCPKCYVALPTAVKDRCTNCGAPLKKN